jgi:hypothetical protein
MNTKFENKSDSTNTGTLAALGEAVKTRISNQIESVKRHVFAEYRAALDKNEQVLRLALFEADVLARQTGYPHLFFPVLASEKAQSAARWQFHQRYLLRNNSPYALAA